MLSVAMMVRNEEEHLERCLKSVMPLSPEIVIVDTGSTDGTLDIAKKYTKNIYHHPWEDNFSLHRNQAAGYCTGDWIFQIDADEELILAPDFTHEQLLLFLLNTKKEINACGIAIRDWREKQQAFVAEFDAIRFFRNGKVHYTRRVHNKLNFEGPAAIFGRGFLKHYGYDLTPEQKKAKAKRTIGLLELSIEEDPKDYPSLFYLAQAYGTFMEDEEKAIEYGEMYMPHKEELGKSFNASIYHLLAALYGRAHNEEKCLQWIQEGLAHDKDDLDLLMDWLQWGLRAKDPMVVATASAKFIDSFNHFPEYRMKHPGKFFFNHNLDALAGALFYHAISMLETGKIELDKLKSLLPNLAPSKQEEIRGSITGCLNALGIKGLFDEEQSRIILPGQNVKPAAFNPNAVLQTPQGIRAK